MSADNNDLNNTTTNNNNNNDQAEIEINDGEINENDQTQQDQIEINDLQVEINNENDQNQQQAEILDQAEEAEMPGNVQIAIGMGLNNILRFINRLMPNNNGNEENADDGDDDDDDDDDDNEDDVEDEDENNNDDDIEIDEQEYEQSIPESINYDLALPSGHTYLGENFERVNAPKTINEVNDEICIPLLSFPGNEQHLFWNPNSNSNNIQLLPGQIMPLYFYSSIQTNLIKKRMKDQDPTIGFALTQNFYKKLMENANNPDLESDETVRLGILAEIIEAKDESTGESVMHGYEGLLIKVRGRERFKIMNVRREITGCLIANVKILPDIVLKTNPLLKNTPKNGKHFLESYLCKNDTNNIDENNRIICTHAKAESLNNFMSNPAWIYRLHDCDYIIYLIIKELNETFRRKITFRNSKSNSKETPINNDNEIDYKDPLFFSNWLLNNFPFSDQMRITCLKYNSVHQRLIYMHSLLKSFTNISCNNCRNQLCASSDVFSLSNQGFMNPFLNPGGVVHETLTVYKLKNFKLSKSPPCTEHSWFPGYGWQICSCKNCNNHIGWKFTATNSNLKPEKFWGLTRKSIRHTYNEEENNSETTSQS